MSCDRRIQNLSYNDFHVIEAIGVNEPKTMTTVAKLMGVTTGTLTKAMDGLTRKGMLSVSAVRRINVWYGFI